MNDLIEIFRRLLAADWSLIAGAMAAISAWVLAVMCAFLRRSMDKPYFSRWAMGWFLFSVASAAGVVLEKMPETELLNAIQLAATGTSAICLFSGSRLLWRKETVGQELRLAVIAIVGWSVLAAYWFATPWWMELPVFLLLAAAGGYTGAQYFRERRRSHAANVLAFVFLLWAADLALQPLLDLLPVLHPLGHLISAGLTVGITFGIMVQEEAELADERYRGVLASVNEAIFIVDLWTLQILDVNEAAQRLTHRPIEKMIGGNIMDIFPDLRREGNNLLANRNMFNAVFKPFNEFHALCADGSAVICEGDTNLVNWRSTPVLHLKVHPVDKGRTLGQMVRRAEKLSSLGQLVAGVAHELNNPLAVVVGYAQLLTKLNIADEKYRTGVEKMLHEGERAAKIVRDLLSFARPCEPQLTVVEVNRLIANVLEVREGDLRAHGIELVPVLAPRLPRTKADAVQIEQVLNNLVTNAMHAMAGAGSPTRKLTITTEVSGFFVKITVADTGPGVPATARDKIFDPFFTTKAPGKGTGLGLAISHTIMEEHHGRITLDAEVKQGAAFVLELPIVPCEPAVEERAAAPTVHEVRSSPSDYHLLVVDDEPGIREVLEITLQSLGYSVHTAANGREAVAQTERRQFDLIISDLCMPEMDGPSLHHHIQVKNKWLANRMIFVTGDTVSPRSREFLESTGNRWLSKPFNIRTVEDTVRDVLERPVVGLN